MQIGVNLWVWGAPITDELVERRVGQAAEMGFDAIEAPLEDPHAFDYDRAKSVFETHDVRPTIVVAMTEERDLLHDDAEVRANGRSYVRESVDAAAAVGADRVVGPLYAAVGRTWQMTDRQRETAVSRVVDQLRELADYAEERDVTLCVEPINRFETSFLNTTEQGVDLIDRVDSPACKLLLDTFHMNIEERSTPAAIRRAGDRIGHFHACGNDRGAPGDGNIDWDGVRAALRDVEYDDQVVIESFTPEVDSIARAAAVWRPLAASQDALAEDGLAFLETLFASARTTK